MPVSTIDRRSFFQHLTGAKHPSTRESKIGTVTNHFVFEQQELPEVPASGAQFTFLSGLTPYTGPWGAAQAAHLLRRTCFGVTKADLNSLLSLSFSEAIDKVLTPSTVPILPPINNYNSTEFTDPSVPSGEAWLDAPIDGNAEGYRIESFRGWWYDRMLRQEASIEERMTLFWHHHFSVQTEISYWGKAIYNYNNTLRANALGNFKTLTKLITLDPAMLLYLNGFLNTKGAPDENYARELQELFTVGKDNPQHYTEGDVVAAARVLTGWKINFETGTSFHYPVDHDFGDKQFSSFYNNTVIAGNISGEVELDALLDMIFLKNEVAEYVCRKLYRWFVYYNIDAATEANVIQPLAEIFRNNNYEVKPVLEALLSSEHFFEATQTGCFVKTPVDIVLGMMRSFAVNIPDTTLYDGFVMRYYLTYFMAEMRMLPGDPPNVAGWQAFRQVPQYYRIWINGDTIRVRNVFTDVMIAYFLETENDQMSIDLLTYIKNLDNPGDPNALINEVVELLLPQPLSASKKYLLKTILLSGLPNDFYWTNAWADYTNNPGDPMAEEVVKTRLTGFFLYLTRLPEFQLA